MKKRIICSLMALSLAASMGLTACDKANSGNNNTTNDDGVQTQQTDGPKKYDDVKLKMLICWNGGFKTATDQYNNEVAKAIREKTGVTVEFEGIMMSETEKLNLMFASGDMPDIVNSPYWGGNAGETEVVKKAGAEGRLLDIKDELPKYPNLTDAYKIGVISQAYLENDLDAPEFKGARYILPQETPGNIDAISNWMYGTFVRGDVGKELGIDPTSIKTPDQLLDFMQKAKDHGFKDANGNACITATTFNNGWDYSRYTEGYSDRKLTKYKKLDDGTVTYDPLTDAWVDRNIFIWKMVNGGILDKECFKQTSQQADEKVGNGTALFVASQFGPVNRATKVTGLYNEHPEMKYVPVGPMNYADGTPLTQLETEGRSGSPAIFFPTTCKDLGAALTWLDFLNSKEGAQLIEYGIVGDTCEMNADGQPRFTKEILDRKAKQDPTIDQELRDKGITYMAGRTICADKKMSWFGEGTAGQADTEIAEEKAYKLARPAEIIKGYPIERLATSFENYDKVKAFAFEGTKEKDTVERAFFAATEDEARKIIKEYQDYLMTQEGGIFKDYLAYIQKISEERTDAAF